MCYGRLVFAEMPLEIRQYETDTHLLLCAASRIISLLVGPHRPATLSIVFFSSPR